MGMSTRMRVGMGMGMGMGIRIRPFAKCLFTRFYRAAT